MMGFLVGVLILIGSAALGRCLETKGAGDPPLYWFIGAITGGLFLAAMIIGFLQ